MKFIIKKRIKKFRKFSNEINVNDIKKAHTILFSVFSRYGDGAISFKIINEFIKKYPDKKYILLTNKQQIPYAKAIIEKKISFYKVNKRNPFEFFYITNLLNNLDIDLGFNPWSHGDDSEYFISFAKKFYCYKDFDKFDKTFNLYDRIRLYFNLNIPVKVVNHFEIKSINKVLIVPFSTDITKNLSKNCINAMINNIKPYSENITIALPKSMGYKNEFIFKKNTQNSLKFLELIKNSDLIISVDSGPLHIASALNKKIIAVFGPTAPETILDTNVNINILRNKKLNGIFCFVKNCTKPICIEQICNKLDFIDFSNQKIILEENKCPL